jgi:membrane dipeptidase
MVTRRRFLHDSLIATAGLSLLPRAAQGDASAPGTMLAFDLHTHPGVAQTPLLDWGSAQDYTRTVDDMRRGGLSGAFFSLIADLPLLERTDTGIRVRGGYAPREAQREYTRQLTILTDRLKTGNAFLATKSADLLRAHRDRKVAGFLGCEGGEFLEGNAETVDRLYADGVRSLQLVHYVPSALGDLQTQPAQHHGLSTAGKAIVKRLNTVGMVVDVAHASFETVRDVVSLATAPIILSHSLLKIDDSRPIAARTISDEHATLVAKTGGVIGAWPSGFNTSFDEFVDNTKRLIDVVGVDHVGLGTDMDGNFKPVFTSYTQLDAWASGLAANGLSKSDVAKVMGGNMRRVLSQVIG